MTNILVMCNAGMSTSMLVKKMNTEAEAQGFDVTIVAKSLTEGKENVSWADVILLGPQVRYELENVKSFANGIPVAVINMQDYGMVKGKKVLEDALALIK